MCIFHLEKTHQQHGFSYISFLNGSKSFPIRCVNNNSMPELPLTRVTGRVNESEESYHIKCFPEI